MRRRGLVRIGAGDVHTEGQTLWNRTLWNRGSAFKHAVEGHFVTEDVIEGQTLCFGPFVLEITAVTFSEGCFHALIPLSPGPTF